MHTFALSFHDAAHGTLHPNRRANELLGHFYGSLILVPLTVYRRAHAIHHARLASTEDPELYPFVLPSTGRAYRMTCAFSEICLGYIYTPLLFLRSVLVDRNLPADVRQRIVREYGMIAAIHIPFLIVVAATSAWSMFLVGVLASAMFGGAYQTLRKYTEHLGLYGSSILESTRSILPRNRWNKSISSLVQHVDHHGAHHVRARVPYFDLPATSQKIYGSKPENLPVYPSYIAAFLAMLPALLDPKIGCQWRCDQFESPFSTQPTGD